MANFFLDNEDIQFLCSTHRPARAGPRPGADSPRTATPTTRRVDAARRGRQLPPDPGDRRPGGRRNDRPQRRAGRPRGQHAQHRRHGDAASRRAREPGPHVAGRPDGLHAAAQVRRPELPQPDLHDGHRDRPPGRRLVHEPVRPAGHRRDDQRLRQTTRSRTRCCRGSPRAK